MFARHPGTRRLFRLIDGKLGVRAAAAVRAHLAVCPACAERFARLERARAALRDTGTRWPVLPARNGTREARLLQTLDDTAAARPSAAWRPLRIAAVLAALLAVVVLLRLRPGASPAPSPAPAATETAGTPVPGPPPDRVTGLAGTLPVAREAARPASFDPAVETRVTLPSGAEIVVAPGSDVRPPSVLDGPVVLVRGRLTVSVTPRGPGRPPFAVETPAARVEAIGTRFTVVHEAGVTTVDVEEGKVRCISLRRAEERFLAAGGALSTDAAGRWIAAADVPAPDAAATGLGATAAAPGGPATAELPAANVQVDAPRAQGTIDRRRFEVAREMADRRANACWIDYADRTGSAARLEGRVELTVLPNGRVGQLRVRFTAGDQRFRECIERVYREARFPRPHGGPVPARFSPTFGPEERDD